MKAILIVLVAVTAAVSGTAQGLDVILSNPESMDFHYVLDPEALASFDPASSIFPSVVYDYFAATDNGPAEFEPLPAGGTRRLEDLTEGSHLLVGFFIEPGSRDFPVRVVRLHAGEGLSERYYSLYRTPVFVSVRAGRGRLREFPAVPARGAARAEPTAAEPTAAEPTAAEPTAAEPTAAEPAAAEPAAAEQRESDPEPAKAQEVPATPAASESPGSSGFFRFQIDNRYDDWDAIPALVAFPTGFRPASFTREPYGRELEVLPIGQSRHWGQGGTALHEFKVVRDQRGIYLYASTHAAITENLSVFLYFQGEEDGVRANRLTLELVPETARAPGLVVLWEKDEEPTVVGLLVSGSFFLEAEILNPMLLPYLESVPGLSYVDVTTCYFDPKELSYEEFYFGSPAFAEIPTPDSLF